MSTLEIVFSDEKPFGLYDVDEDVEEKDKVLKSNGRENSGEEKQLKLAEKRANRLARETRETVPKATESSTSSNETVWQCDTTSKKYREDRQLETDRLERINRLLDLP